MIRRLRKQRGFTLVELMIVVAIIGILAALAVYGVKRYLTNAKTGEVKENLGRLGKDASAAYQREAMAGSVLADNADAGAVHRLCGSSTAVPATVPSNSKVQPAADAWGGDNLTGWRCLRFSINDPIYYQYSYENTGTGTGFTAWGRGNLNGTGGTSDWTVMGVVAGGVVKVAPTIAEPPDYTE